MLSPYRVLDLTDQSGQLCGQILADLGADVVIVEPPEGSSARQIAPFRDESPESLYWLALNRNKRGITLDLRTDAGRDELRGLVRSADFLIESFAPGYLEGLGLGYEQLKAINPRLVMVSITPFGQDGPKAGWAATELTAYAASGFHPLVGDEDRPPVKVGQWQAWMHAGGEAAIGALLAHHGRERDGTGQHVDVSAQTAMMLSTQSLVLQHGWGENPVRRVAGGVALGPLKLQLIYPCKDGFVTVTFLFGTAIGPFSRRLMELMCEEGFVDEATRDKDWLSYTTLLLSGQEPISELLRCMDAINEFTKSHTKAELFDLALTRGLLIVPVNTTADLRASEQLATRDYWTDLRHDDGSTITYPGPFAKFSATPIVYRRPAPRLGQHTAEVRREWQAARPRSTTPPAQADTTPRRLPLDSVKVLDFTWVIVGPSSIRYLADYGATVVRVESATRIDSARTFQPFKDATPGPERSGLYANVNAGKLGLTLNLSRPEAREVVLKLVRWADIVAESFTPKAMRAWGMSYEALREVNPGLIMLSTSLNGQNGPHANLAGFGTMGGAAGGFAELHGWPDRMPAGAGAYTDYAAPKFIVSSILAALEYRRRTGTGQYIDLSQVEASVHFLGPAFLDYTVNGRVQSRQGNASSDHAPHGVYPVAGDDRWIAIAATTEQQWLDLLQVAGHREWHDDARFTSNAGRLANREALDTLLAHWTHDQDGAALEATLQRAAVPAHRVNTSADCFADSQLQARGHFVTVEHAEFGPVPLESSRMRFSATPARPPRPGPSLGQDNEHVLRMILGMSDEEVVELIASGALE